MKIARNNDYGGFSLSEEAAKKLREKGVKVVLEGEYYRDGSGPKTRGFGGTGRGSHHLDNEDFGITSSNYLAWRADPRLIEVIEEIGTEKASGDLSDIVIVDIPDGTEWEIDNYDGIETVDEVHNSW